MKTSELTGPALDWAVAKCAWEPEQVFLYGEPVKHVRVANWPDIGHEYNLSMCYTPSTDWAQGGPIIEREGILLIRQTLDRWVSEYSNGCGRFDHARSHGPTPLIAAMRCYVASKLGEDVEIPEELT